MSEVLLWVIDVRRVWRDHANGREPFRPSIRAGTIVDQEPEVRDPVVERPDLLMQLWRSPDNAGARGMTDG
jgi:hypothetical protein